MRGKTVKVLRKLFLEGLDGDDERAQRRYDVVRHHWVSKRATESWLKGGFLMCQAPRLHYLQAKHVFMEVDRFEKRKMIVRALAAIKDRTKQLRTVPQ